MHIPVKTCARLNDISSGDTGISANNGGFDYLFERIAPRLLEADITLGNLEFPVSAPFESRPYVFNCRPEVLGADATLYRRYERPLFDFISRMAPNAADSESLFQETFLRLFRYRDRYRPTAPFRSFLYTLARHAWVDATRRSERQRAVPLGGREDIPGELDVRRDGHLNLEDRLDLEQALEELPEHLRWTIVLSVHQGLSYGEIAEVLQIPVGTVKSRIFHAVRRLREALHARLDP